MSWFRSQTSSDPLSALSSAVDHLRSDLGALRTLVTEQAQEIATLRQERALRETEMADLRTRYETLIKRVGARLDKTERAEAEPESPLAVRRRVRGF